MHHDDACSRSMCRIAGWLCVVVISGVIQGCTAQPRPFADPNNATATGTETWNETITFATSIPATAAPPTPTPYAANTSLPEGRLAANFWGAPVSFDSLVLALACLGGALFALLVATVVFNMRKPPQTTDDEEALVIPGWNANLQAKQRKERRRAVGLSVPPRATGFNADTTQL